MIDMILLIVVLILLWLLFTSGNGMLVFLGIVWLVGIVLCVMVTLDNPQPQNPSQPRKSSNQTEQEFNEMAITTMYANYYLDKDD